MTNPPPASPSHRCPSGPSSSLLSAAGFTLAVVGAALLVALPVLAHEGHGMPGSSHWHADDAFGFALAVAGLVWLARRGK